MKILITLCARAGSKGVANKNVKEFNGFPICYYTLSAYQLFCKKNAEKYEAIDLAVNTDSEHLIRQINRTRIPYITVKRENDLANDTAAKVDVLKDTLLKAEEFSGNSYDILLDLDLTSPLRTVEDIEGVLQTLLESTNGDVAFSMTDARRNPYFNMVSMKENGFLGTVIKSDFVARQQTPPCFDMNASIYAYRRAFLLKDKKTLFDGNALGFMMEDTGILDIDSERDYELMQLIAAYLYSKNKGMKEIFENINNL